MDDKDITILGLSTALARTRANELRLVGEVLKGNDIIKALNEVAERLRAELAAKAPECE